MFSPLSIQIENYMVMRFKLMNHKEIKLTIGGRVYGPWWSSSEPGDFGRLGRRLKAL